MVSISTMIEQLEGLTGTNDLTAWENDFVMDIARRWRLNKKRTDFFSTKVVVNIERIWRKHFAA